MSKRKKKSLGQVFTPPTMVNLMLDQVGYYSESILEKHVIDNSCGEGAFLLEVVKRYVEVAKEKELPLETIKNHLQTYIHGIEVDPTTHQTCLDHLDEYLKTENIFEIQWDVHCLNALTCEKYQKEMDYVVGNPPYIRIHELYQQGISLEQFKFCQKGMVDSFLAFYELGLKMLNSTGKLIYIAPKSWLQSQAGEAMRETVVNEQLLAHIIDLGHFQPFKATTYPNIVCLEKTHQQNFLQFSQFDGDSYGIKNTVQLPYEKIQIQGKFYLGQPDFLPIFSEMLTQTYDSPIVVVRNGMTTNCDEVFFHPDIPKHYTIPMLKASKGLWHPTFFPYDQVGNPLPLDVLLKDEEVKNFLFAHEPRLKQRDLASEDEWYLFGRNQGLKDVAKQRFAINTIVKSVDTLRLIPVAPGEGIYAGLYLLTEKDESSLIQAFKHPYFLLLLETIGRYRSGGYYTYSSKEISQYLNYYFEVLAFKKTSV